MDDFILFKNVSFCLEDSLGKSKNYILKDLNFKINSGEFVTIVGKNGCGKSTLAKHFNAVLTPSIGDVLVDGVNTKDEKKVFDIRKKVGLVLQNPDNQIISSVVEEDVAFGLENLGFDREFIIKNVCEALTNVGMYEYRKFPTHALSGGQKQRIAIAGVLAMDPECIVLDEPTSMLDPNGRKEVLDTIISLNKKFDTTIVMVTHDMYEISLSSKVIVMDGGKIISETIPERLFSSEKSLYRYGLFPSPSMKLLYNLEKDGYKIKEKSPDISKCTKEILSLLEEN